MDLFDNKISMPTNVFELPLNNDNKINQPKVEAHSAHLDSPMSDQPSEKDEPQQPPVAASTPLTAAAMHTAQEKDDVSNIPLPDPAPPSVAQFPLLVDRLLKQGQIDTADKIEWQKICTAQGALHGTLFIVKTWRKNYEEGRRVENAPRCYAPDQTLFPGATTTTFRLDNFLLLMGDQQPATTKYLTTGFTNGFMIELDEDFTEEYETTVYENGLNPTPAAEAAFALSIRKDHELGYVALRPPLWGAVYVASPSRAEPKKSSGEPTGKYRKVHNLTKDSKNMPSINEGIMKKNTRIKYTTVEDAAQDTIVLKRTSGERVLYMKCDGLNAYRLFCMHPSQVGLLGFRDNESPPREWVELRLPFGLASGCRMYSALSNTVGWALQYIAGTGIVKVYLDDTLQINVASKSGRLATHARNICAARHAAERQNGGGCPRDCVLGHRDGRRRRDTVDLGRAQSQHHAYREVVARTQTMHNT